MNMLFPVNAPRRVFSFSVIGQPTTQGSARAFVPKGWTRPIITSANPRLKDWRALVAVTAGEVSARELHGELLQGAIRLELAFMLPRPKSLPKRVQRHTKKPDLDKLVRAVKDALSHVLYRDDAQVCELEARKAYGHPVGVHVTIAECED